MCVFFNAKFRKPQKRVKIVSILFENKTKQQNKKEIQNTIFVFLFFLKENQGESAQISPPAQSISNKSAPAAGSSAAGWGVDEVTLFIRTVEEGLYQEFASLVFNTVFYFV